MEVNFSFYNGKELYYSYICGYRFYFHKNFVQNGNVKFPVIGCDIIEVDSNFAVIPGNYNLFKFSCDGEIKNIDNAIKVIKLLGNICVLILSKQDNVKIKWIDTSGIINKQWITVLCKDGIKEEIASEELLKYL